MIYLVLFYFHIERSGFAKRAVGGGLATLPFLSSLGARTGWFTQGMLADMVAVSESTPGPIGVNMATYVGFTTAGVPGAVVATIGLITPSVIIILIIAGFLEKFRQNKYVDQAFYGIRPASTALITAALIGLMAISLFGTSTAGLLHISSVNIKPLILFALLMAVTNIKKVKDLHPIVFIAASAVIGIIFRFSE